MSRQNYKVNVAIIQELCRLENYFCKQKYVPELKKKKSHSSIMNCFLSQYMFMDIFRYEVGSCRALFSISVGFFFFLNSLTFDMMLKIITSHFTFDIE